MTSQLTWIDHDSGERDRMNRILSLFQERETRDELGLGGIRDAISDLLFPGTSTIQTRLRYFFFVPWICDGLEADGLVGDAMSTAVRRREYVVRCALLETEDAEGVIGKQAGESLQRGPASIYWAGLGRWGLRHFEGSQEDYYRSLPLIHRARAQRKDVDNEEDKPTRRVATWHPDLPSAPAGFPEQASLALTTDEAGFLRDLIALKAEGSALAALAAQAESPIADVAQVWEWPGLSAFDDGLRDRIEHARRFSLAMNGAALLYNQLLAEKSGNDDWVEQHSKRVEDWAARVDGGGLETWSPSEFWETVWDQGHTITPRTQRFVERWLGEVRAGPATVRMRASACSLIEARESQLKGARSRFRNPRALDQWGGSSAVAPLDFRWRTARRYLLDLHAALAGDAGGDA